MQTSYQNATLRRRAITSAVFLRKKETCPMGQCNHKDPSKMDPFAIYKQAPAFIKTSSCVTENWKKDNSGKQPTVFLYPALCVSFHIHNFLSLLLPLFLCLISLLLFPCASAWEIALHEFPISNRNTEWNLRAMFRSSSYGEVVFLVSLRVLYNETYRQLGILYLSH